MLKLDQITEAIAADNYIGFCKSCGEEHHNCEPDMQREKCQSCGEFEVYGAEQLFIMGAYDDEDEKPQKPDPKKTPKPRVPSIQQLLTGKQQTPGIRPYARKVFSMTGLIVHRGTLIIRVKNGNNEETGSRDEQEKAKTVIRVFSSYGKDSHSEHLVIGSTITINNDQCRRMIGTTTGKQIACVNELWRRAAEKHGSVYRWFASIEIGDHETCTPSAIIGLNTAGQRVAVIACVIDEDGGES